MAHRNGKTGLAIGASVLALALALPVVGQESLLPPGFEQPARPSPAPAPRPSPSPTPRPGTATPSPTPAPRPSAPGVAPAPAPDPARSDGATPSPRPDTIPGFSPLSGLDTPLAPGEGEGEEALPPPPPRYDLPPGSRRLLTRIGPLTVDSGGLAPGAFGNRGRYVTALIDGIRAPVVSRWSAILLRRAMVSGVDTPTNINGADFVAARANLMLRQGEAAAARMLVQSVDIDRASPRLRAAALQVAIANADPALTCPYVPAMAGRGDDSWDLAQAMCAALVAESGTAGAILERVRRRGRLAAIDIKLAEKVVGAGPDSRRSAVVLWDDVDRLTPWRLGLANATGVEVPADLWRSASPAMRSWAVQSPMMTIDQRLPYAADAAAKGVLSARAYVDLVALHAEGDDAADGDYGELARTLRLAFIAANLSDRVAAITGLGSAANGGYAGRVLAARAAARLAPVRLSDAESHAMLMAMFAGGLDRNAMAWATAVNVGSQGWGLLAVGSPRPLVGVTAGQVDDFAGSDDSVDGLRTRFLAASLIGLGRVSQDDAREMANDLALGLGTETRWTRGIVMAADRGEAGTVALLVAVGLQGSDWRNIEPFRLYQITRALRRVGLGAEARMIAAEALSRV